MRKVLLIILVCLLALSPAMATYATAPPGAVNDGSAGAGAGADVDAVEGADVDAGAGADAGADVDAVEGADADVDVDVDAGVNVDAGTDTGADYSAIEAISGNLENDGGLSDMGHDISAFSLISGEITKIDTLDGYPCIRVSDSEGGETDFLIIDKRTVLSDLDRLIDFDAIAVGNIVDVYYTPPLAMTLQYPPRFNAAVVVVHNENNPGSVFVGIIDDDGRASDNSVIINIAEDVPIIRQSNGLGFGDGRLTGRPIIVYYMITTRSYPPIALATKVIVLNNIGVPFYLNGLRVLLYDAVAYFKSDGTVLLPVRAIVESLGYQVEWNGEDESVRVGAAIYMTIGSDEYTVGRMVPIKLDAAAELINDRTYAPLSFYNTILHLDSDDSCGILMLSGDKE